MLVQVRVIVQLFLKYEAKTTLLFHYKYSYVAVFVFANKLYTLTCLSTIQHNRNRHFYDLIILFIVLKFHEYTCTIKKKYINKKKYFKVLIYACQMALNKHVQVVHDKIER